MNRAERRAAAALAKKLAAPQKRRPPRQPGKPIRPWPHEVRHVFAPIEQMFEELRQGEITEIDGHPAFRDGEGNWLTVAPAIAGERDDKPRDAEHEQRQRPCEDRGEGALAAHSAGSAIAARGPAAGADAGALRLASHR